MPNRTDMPSNAQKETLKIDLNTTLIQDIAPELTINNQ